MNKDHFKLISKTILMIVIFGMSSVIYGQERGLIIGRIVDQQTGSYLPGANIMLVDTYYGAASDREGEFRIPNVPVGNYTVIVRYMGYETYTTNIAITQIEQRVSLNISLIPSYVEMGEIVVEGLRQGRVRALSEEREAQSIKNVVSREQLEWFPDQNVAEALQRVPGVHISRSLGDGRYALIRGTEPRLSAVTVDGMSLATTRHEERYTQLDIVSADQLAFLEVIKAITPDMDANTIGGTVNIVTRSAFDYPGRHMSLRLGSGYADLGANPLYQASLVYSDKFGRNQNFGYTVNASWHEKSRGTDRIEPEWGEERDVLGNLIPFALRDLSIRDYQNTKTNIGLGGSLEYRPSTDHRLFANITYSKFNDDQNRARWRIRPSNGNYLDPEGMFVSRARFEFDSDHRLEENIQTNYRLGGEHYIRGFNIDYSFGYSYGEQFEYPNVTQTYRHDNNIDMAFDFSKPDYPNFVVVHDNELIHYDASLYRFRGYDYRRRFNSNSHYVANLNIETPYDFLSYPATFKLGAKYHIIYKDKDDSRYDVSWGGSRIYMAEFLLDRTRNDFMNGNYIFGPQPDNKKFLEFFYQHLDQEGGFTRSMNYSDTYGQTYDAIENIYAYYAMTDIKFGKFSVLAGFRHEFTYNDYDGTYLLYDLSGDYAGHETVKHERNYNRFLPMVHLRYDLARMTNLRFAYTQTFARPDYWHLVPYLELDHRRERIRQGNPDLMPTTAHNIDIMGSHYFDGIGIASVGLFYKDLSHIIYNQTTIIDEGPWAGYLTDRNPVNGGDAYIMGFELNWQQELTFLPGVLSGLGVLANYTYTKAEADLVEREGYLPGQAGDVANLGLSYNIRGFEAVLSYSYQGEYLSSPGRTIDHDIMVDSRGTLDLTVKQKVISGLSIDAEFVNITNQPSRAYMGTRARPIDTHYFSWWSRVGLRYTF